MMKAVTIIIPVYKDWETLEICLNSLIKYIPDGNKILIINDMGPQWRQMENNIKDLIEGHPMFIYERNPNNVGFIKTCNRGVFESDNSDNDILLLNSDTCVTEGFLEEMLYVLYSNERHGAVCPRSNNATLLTVPINNNLKRKVTFEESYKIYQAIKDKLPRQAVIPTGVGFAILIKREIIRKFGLFDEIYGAGYQEENDFCQRINRYGYNTLMSNYSFVYHFEGRSFGEKNKQLLEEKNSNILLDRYPYYEKIIKDYFNNQVDVIDYFSDMISECIYRKKRILISLYELPSIYNGSTEYNLAFIEEFYKKYKEKYEIFILVNRRADNFFKISDIYPNVLFPDTIKETFHLAFVPSQIYHIEHLLILNKTSLKFIFCMQDIISIRTNHLLILDYERQEVFRKAIRYCDGMTSISEFSLKDTTDYYFKEFEQRNIETKIIYHGVNNKKPVNKEDFSIPFEEYFIVFGNFYEHKWLKETLPFLIESVYNYVIIGMNETGFEAKNIYGLKSGEIEDEHMNYLTERSIGILFPSIYEGFGLPIVNAIQFRKKIILQRNELNIELKNYFKYYESNFFLYDYGEELENIFKLILSNQKCHIDVDLYFDRTWQDVTEETENFINKVLEEPLDYNKLYSRWDDLKGNEKINDYQNTPIYKVSSEWLIKCIKYKTKMKIKEKFPKLLKYIKRRSSQ
ncbi:glycosyltransferase [Kineothrix sp. MB12-C1]|uniref:glycosyltransferase n=1 Tax=Kineothrix sp. MB12-C1 TaxID=3070215 RepID=UPI0027D2AFBF|nr:glycosyltransferase [Kineothrix sp. MB12-C1]WMC91700.1 glycosyltransferase [Kineothrix sp. MB12-C1]